MKKIFISLCAVVACSSTFADVPVEHVLLARTEKVDALCAGIFKRAGIYCAQHQAENNDGWITGNVGVTMSPAGAVGVPVIASDRLPSDPRGMKVLAILDLKQVHTEIGPDYYSGTTEIFAATGRGVDPTSRFSDSVWAFIAREVRTVEPGSVEIKAYLQQNNDLAMPDTDQTVERHDSHALDQHRGENNGSQAGQAALAARAIEQCKQTISAAKRAIARDDKISAISGYQNKALREHAAVMIVDCQETISKGGRP